MLIRILSAGVITAIVAGLFSLWVSFSNNKRLAKLEKSRQKFTIAQERYRDLKEAYSELLSALPQEETLGYHIMNKGFEGNGYEEAYQIANDNREKLNHHFQTYGFLLSNDEQKQVRYLMDKTDKVAQNIICVRSGIDGMEQAGIEEAVESMNKSVNTYFIQVVELVEMYCGFYRDNLSTLANAENI